MTTTPRALHRNDLRKISELPTNLALRMAVAFLADLVEDPDFMGSEVLPFLKESEGAGS